MAITQRPVHSVPSKPTDALITQPKGDLRNHAGIKSYTQHWDKDALKDTPEMMENRKAVYTDVVNSYYDGATELYEWGWGGSFHFCRYYRGEAFYQAMARHEHYLALQISLRPGLRVLDVGCGIGGPARAIARFSDVQVVGVNNNAFQVQRAKKYAEKESMEGKVRFVKGDFMNLVELFGESSFDAVYAIEATCHAPDWEACYDQIRRVLKPGGIFGVYEWCLTANYDAANPHHRAVAHGIEVGDGIPEMRTIEACRTALVNVGFEILDEDDLAERDDEIKWYYPLEGKLGQAQTLWDLVTVWRMTAAGKYLTQKAVWLFEKVGLVPSGTHNVGEALKTAADSLVAGGREKLFTPMQLFVCRKPAEAAP